jgi:hypothetical protein
MTRKPYHHRCACCCHKTVKSHAEAQCECGGPIKPPRGHCRPQPKPCPCPVPETCPQPGTVDVPQDQVPPTPTFNPRPKPGEGGRPPRGDPGEGAWFQGKVGTILRKGPSFGKRKDEYLPYLVIRSQSGDTGNRPFSGVFWESPDIGVLPNVDAATAPLMPPDMGGVAVAGRPNTLYAHVWNLGKAPAYRVRVEFYWFNPSLGISRADAHLVGAAWVDLGDRFTVYPNWREVTQPYGNYISRGCHAIVRCPETWIPQMLNNGHECLVARAFEPMMDSVSPDQFSPAQDRHIGQRNLAVIEANSPASIDLALNLGWPTQPGDAEVDVQLEGPNAMEFLKLLTHDKAPAFQPSTHKIVYGLMPPTAPGSRVPPISGLPLQQGGKLLRTQERFYRGCEPLSVTFHASAENLEKKQAQVLRIRQKVAGDVVGGYTVLMINKG